MERKKIDKLADAFRAYLYASKTMQNIDHRVLSGVNADYDATLHVAGSLVLELANEINVKPVASEDKISIEYNGLLFWGFASKELWW